MNNTTIFLGTALVVIIIYVLYQSYFDGEQKLATQTKLSEAVTVAAANVAKPGNSIFTYSIWIYVNKLTNDTAIFNRESELGLKLSSNASLTLPYYLGGSANAEAPEITLTDNFPLQKWVHVGIVVDNKVMDAYIDGKMVKSIALTGLIQPQAPGGQGTHGIIYGAPDTNVTAQNTYIAEFKRITYALDPKGVWDLYTKGNGVSSLTKAASTMNVNLSILKDGVETSNFKVY